MIEFATRFRCTHGEAGKPRCNVAHETMADGLPDKFPFAVTITVPKPPPGWTVTPEGARCPLHSKEPSRIVLPRLVPTDALDRRPKG